MADVTLEQVISVCGNYTRQVIDNYNFQCPICAMEGHDKHKDNLIYSKSKQIVYCFVNREHSLQVLDMINKQSPKEYISKPIKSINKVNKWELNKEEYVDYMTQCSDYLITNADLLNYLIDKRGLLPKTIQTVGMGFDHTENCFVIPIISLKYGCITDFELRLKSDKKQIRRVGGGCNTIAKIYGKDKNDTLYIVEGFIDGYVLLQWLLEKNQKDFTIYSCSNGVSSLINALNEIKFNNFKKIKLILDNDEAGDKAVDQIIEKYPFMIDSREFLKLKNHKDICEYYNLEVNQ